MDPSSNTIPYNCHTLSVHALFPNLPCIMTARATPTTFEPPPCLDLKHYSAILSKNVRLFVFIPIFLSCRRIYVLVIACRERDGLFGRYFPAFSSSFCSCSLHFSTYWSIITHRSGIFYYDRFAVFYWRDIRPHIIRVPQQAPANSLSRISSHHFFVFAYIYLPMDLTETGYTRDGVYLPLRGIQGRIFNLLPRSLFERLRTPFMFPQLLTLFLSN